MQPHGCEKVLGALKMVNMSCSGLTFNVAPPGWFDRVYAGGFAYWVGEQSATRNGDRFGEGRMAGKRALCMVSQLLHAEE